MLLKNYNFFRVFFYFVLLKLSLFFVISKNMNPTLKYVVFVKTSKNTKTNMKIEKLFLCIRPSVSYYVFHTPKNNVLACILVLITSLLKSREHWSKFQKQQKFYSVCLLVSGV